MVNTAATTFPLDAAVLAAFLFLMAVLCRNVCNLGFVERPITIGLIWSMLTGDTTTALPVSLFFELFWLDLFAIGSYIPPMGSFPLLVLLPLAQTFGWQGAEHFGLPIILSLPLAYLPVIIEKWHRKQQIFDYMRIIRMANRESLLGKQSTLIIARFAVSILCGSLAAYFLILFAVIQVWNIISHLPVTLNVNWAVLHVIASIGALMALRIQRAYIIFAIAMILMTTSNW